MQRLLGLIAVSLFLIVSANAQAGRKIKPNPTPVPVGTPVITYSESKPNPSRRTIFTKRTSSKSATTLPQTDGVRIATGADEEIEKVETELITIPVSVFDRSGLYIPNLAKENFRIFEDGVEQEIAYFGTDDKPFTVVLLLDTSLSTEYKISEIQEAARAFVENLQPRDSVMVIEFDGNVHVLTETTNDREKIFKAIGKADFGYGTALYESVEFSLQKRLSKVSGRKAIVLFTDGVDTRSTRATYDSTLDLAEESDSLVFPIYYNTISNQRRNSGIFRDPIGSTEEEYELGRKYLEELSMYTGGRLFRPEATPGGLTRAFEGIAEELRRQYNIGYVPKDSGKQGQRKQIRVRVDRPNLVLRARDSYIVGASAVQPVVAPKN
ncbi:MAG TPA: VWA domain-containing protein [Pyrinomonadaceae bacterium]|nr:VWA domain-containing protein [Pyrinomonadaceae bacterium]